jgi:hypothetical protein
MLGMQLYGKRSIQSVLKATGDQLLPPIADPRFAGFTPEEQTQIGGIMEEASDNRDDAGRFFGGFVYQRNSTMVANADHNIRIQAAPGGAQTTTYIAQQQSTEGASDTRSVVRIK